MSIYSVLRHALACALTLLPLAARAEVTRVEIHSRVDVLGGRSFGAAGPYEKIVGEIFFAVDPTHRRNKGIVDIGNAPRNAMGRVEFSADLYVLAPKDRARGNGAALFDVLARGGKLLYRNFSNAAAVHDPTTEADFGDAFLLQSGFALVWVGWQFDVSRRDGRMALDAPPVTVDGRPVTGRVATRFVPQAASQTFALQTNFYHDVGHYPPVDPGSADNRLEVRDDYLSPPRIIPRDWWQFGRLDSGRSCPTPQVWCWKRASSPVEFMS